MPVSHSFWHAKESNSGSGEATGAAGGITLHRTGPGPVTRHTIGSGHLVFANTEPRPTPSVTMPDRSTQANAKRTVLL